MSDNSQKVLTAFVVGVAFVFVASILYMGGLSFEPIKDEEQFWDQITAFANSWPPTLEQLRHYEEPMTPLSFLLGAWIENTFGLGVAGPRVLSIVVSISVLMLIAHTRTSADRDPTVPVLSAVALLLYPYWLPLSILMYTDVLTALFVVLGCWSYAREKHWASGVFFILAIATRQYMVIFPAAILAFEAIAAMRERDFAWARWTPYGLAILSLVGWIFFFGGIGPEEGLANWPRHSSSLERLSPSYTLYFLSAIGIYFVVPEAVVDRSRRNFRLKFDARMTAALLILAAAFLVFTPNYEVGAGPINRTLIFVLGKGALGVFIKLAVLFALACLTVARFVGMGLGSWFVIANGCLMVFMWNPWEKYCLPLLAALWILKVAGALDARSTLRISMPTRDNQDPEAALSPRG